MPGYNPYQYYPMSYQNQQQIPQQMVQQMPQQVQTTQIQNGGFVSVRGEMEARNYPVAPGNSITFKDETAPYVYTKTMGFSQLDRPTFEKYKLVKEEAEITPEATQQNTHLNDEITNLKSEIEKLWEQIEGLKNDYNKPEPAPKRTAKREKDGDD